MNQQRKNLKRWFSILLTIIFCFTLVPTTAFAKAKIDANTNLWSASNPNSGADKYDSNWIYWSQGASKYGGKMQSSGCRVVAQAKLLKETGIVTAPTSQFNPDTYIEWAYKNGFFGDGKQHFTKYIGEITKTAGKAPVEYAKTLGKTLTLEKIVDLSGNNATDVKTVMDYINQGYYVILGCAAHHVYVHRGMSLQKKTPVIVDSFKGSSYNEEVVVNYDGYHNKSFGCTFTKARLYKVGNPVTGTTTNTTPTAQTVQIMFNGNGGTVSEKTRTINKGSALGSFPKATRSGYTLKGWYRVNTAVASLKVTETQKINNNMILFAVWTKNTSTATSTTTSAATKTYYVKGTDGTLVMRKGPGSGYAQQTLIPEGAAVKVTPSKNSGSWWYVTYNGKSGYSYGKYLTTTAPKATQLIKDGTYEIAPNYATNMRLDVSGASKDNGANVQIYKANGTNAQKWKFKHLGNDYYTITCVASGKVLDVKSGNSKPGANVQQWGSNGSNAQIWKVKKADNGSYYLCPKLNEKVCLDVYKGGKTNSTNVTTWTLNNAYNQKWKIF